jgi:zinc protease
MPPRDVIMARNLEEMRAWLEPQLARGPVELAVIGDLDVDGVIAAVAKTLGTLPPRAPRQAPANQRRLSFPHQPFALEYTIRSAEADGRVVVYWPTTDGLEARRDCQLDLLASILRERLREHLREGLGVVYSPRVASFASNLFPGYGYLEASLDVEPTQVESVGDLVLALAVDLGNKGISDDELNRARQPALTAARDARRTNGYWLGSVLIAAQEHPEVLDRARQAERDLLSCTASELSSLASSYLRPQRASRVTLLPEPQDGLARRRDGTVTTAAATDGR